MSAKVFSRPADRELLLSDYRKTISHGARPRTVLEPPWPLPRAFLAAFRWVALLAASLALD